VPFADVPSLHLWPNELKSLAIELAQGRVPAGIHTFVSDLEDPATPPRPVGWHAGAGIALPDAPLRL
jgi:hypothetical protein